MPFTFKLSQRLARMRCTALVLTAAALAACEKPMTLTDTGNTAASRIVVSPKTATLRTDQAVDIMAVALTTTGDTAALAVTWSVTSGSVTDTSTTGGRHYGHYKAGSDTGKVKVIARGNPGGSTDTAVVTVTAAPVSAVTITPASASVLVGQVVQLAATTLDSAGNVLIGRSVTWTSSNASVATVSGTGLVTGAAAGSTTLTATSEGLSGTASITVSDVPVATVTVSPAATSLTIGGTQQFTATPKDANGNPLSGRVITWTSSNSGVATVNGTGLVGAAAAGSATVTATSEGKSGTATITVTSPPPAPVATVAVSPGTASFAVGGTQQLTATLRDASGNVLMGRTVTWTSSALTVATVSGSGLVTALLAGTTTITATSEGQSGTATVTVTALPPPPSSGGWTNEPTGVTVVSDYGFNDLFPITDADTPISGGSGWNSIYNGNGYMTRGSDASAPLSPSNVVQFLYPIGFPGSQGPATAWHPLPGLTRAYVGQWWKVSNPWQGHASNVNKIGYLVVSAGSIFLAMYGPPGGPYELRVFPQFTGVSQDVWLTPNVAHVPVTLGTWHKLEWLVDFNGGVVKWWMDGQLLGSYTGVPMPTSGFIEYHLDPVWGGCCDTKTETDYYWFDHIHISGN